LDCFSSAFYQIRARKAQASYEESIDRDEGNELPLTMKKLVLVSPFAVSTLPWLLSIIIDAAGGDQTSDEPRRHTCESCILAPAQHPSFRFQVSVGSSSALMLLLSALLTMASGNTTNRKKEEPLLPQFFTKRDLDVEDSEGAVLDSIEGRHPLRRPRQDDALLYHAMHDDDGDKPNNTAKKPSFKQTVRQVQGTKPSLRQVVRQVQGMNAAVMKLKRASRDLEKTSEPDGLLRSTASADSRHHDIFDHKILHSRDSTEEEEEDPLDGDGSTLRLTPTSFRGRTRSFFCDPSRAFRLFCRALNVSLMLWIAVPLSMAAFILYYYADDPEVDFLPGEETLSWWFNFAARLCVTLELAFLSQWLLVDCILLTTGFAGPLVTLTFLQAKGWPFVLTSWSLLNLVWLQGDNRFQRHWLYWTNLTIYSTATGDDILMSTLYLRLLVAGVIAGCLTALKRTYVALQFGGRQLNQFKPRLEKLLVDAVILSEIGSLAVQVQGLEDSGADSGHLNIQESRRQGKRWLSVDFQTAAMSDDDGREESTGSTTTKASSGVGESSSTSSVLKIKELLERWQDPVSKRDRVRQA
jgi:hypothetical protein